jgi:hypothetical protein
MLYDGIWKLIYIKNNCGEKLAMVVFGNWGENTLFLVMLYSQCVNRKSVKRTGFQLASN